MTSRHLGLGLRGIGIGINFLLVFYIGEKFRDEFSSIFFQYHSLLMLISVITKLGFDDIVTKISVRDFKQNNSSFLIYLLKNSYIYFFFNFILAISIFFLIDIQFSFATLLFFIFLYNLNVIFFSYLNGVNKLIEGSFPLFIVSPLLIFGFIYFFDISSWIELVNLYIISFLISLIIYLIIFIRIYKESSTLSFKYEIKKNIFPIATSSIAGGIGIYFSIYILGFRLNSNDLILWTYSVKIVQVLSIVVLLFNIYYAPIFRKFFINQDFKSIQSQLNKQIKYSTILLVAYIFLVPFLFNTFQLNNDSQLVTFESLFICLVIGYGISMIFSSIGSLSIMLDKQNLNGILGFTFSTTMIILFYFTETKNIFFYAITLSFCVAMPKIILFIYFRKYFKLNPK